MRKNYDKNLAIVIIGLGSIGQRHYKNLKKLGYNNLAVYDPGDSAFKEFKKVRRLSALRLEALKKFKIAFICSPNNLHVKQALICAQAGLHLFIEKPLSHNLASIKQLDEKCKKRKLIAMAACNLRFHPCLKFIKQYLAAGKLGRVYSIAHEFGYYLPWWRAKGDYRKNYAAKKASGGGIILDDIHEFDLLFWLNDFKPTLESKFIYNNTGALEIAAEDNCLATFKFNNGVLGLVKCDYLQKAYSRSCKIVGARGNLEWNFKENIVWLKTRGSNRKLLAIKNYDFNQAYLEELRYFFAKLKKKQKTFNDIKTAARVLKYCVSK